MDNYSIALRNYIEALTYDDDELFGHCLPHYFPICEPEDLEDEHGGCSYYRLKWYSEEKKIPDDYVIVTKDVFQASSEYEEARTIKLENDRIAIPRKWYFRIKGMDIYEQWNFIRRYAKDLPDTFRKKKYLKDALLKAYDLGREEEIMQMFYDMKEEHVSEYDKRMNAFKEKIATLESDVKECLQTIRTLRTSKVGWDKYYDELYKMYETSDYYGEHTLYEYCVDMFNRVTGAWLTFRDFRRKNSVAMRISSHTRRYNELTKRLEREKTNMRYFEMSHQIR